MAGGPYRDQNGGYYIVWSDKRAYPDRPKVREQLRTKKAPQAHKRMHRLEELYNAGKHNPWQSRWYDSASLKPFITGSLLNGNLNDLHIHQNNLTLIEASEQYIAYQVNRPSGWKSPITQKRYVSELRYFVRELGGHIRLSSITAEDIHHVLYRPQAKSDQTIAGNRSKLVAFFNYCKKQGWIQRTPDIEAPPPMQKVPKFIYELNLQRTVLTKIAIEQQRLDGPQHQFRFALTWLILAGTGMRPAEAFGVRLQDLHGDHILVGGSKRTKTNAQRMVPLLYSAGPAATILASALYRDQDPQLSGSDLLCGIESHQTGKRVNSEFVACYKAANPQGERRTLYNLRDTFAVRFLSDSSQGNQDFRLLQLRNILGHRSITTTEKYLKAVPGRLDITAPKSTNYVKIFDEIFSKVST